MEGLELAQSTDARDGASWWRRTLALLVASLLAVGAFVTFVAFVGEHGASANTPSDYSKTFYVGSGPGFSGLPVTVGWTQDHAWVITSWAAAMAEGAGTVAGQLCALVSGEPGPFNPVGRACSTAVSGIVAELTAGEQALTDHGLWVAYYVWGGRTTASGTW